MRKYFFPYIASTILLILIVACNSRTETVKANPKFHDTPSANINMEMTYQDTTIPDNKELVRKLDSFYNIQARFGFNGSVLIGHNGKILYERYFGFANREALQPIRPISSSQLASTSKTFTAAAILYLHQQKYLNINEKVKTYIPSFPYPEVTVKMLLCHRSGVPDYIKWIPQYRKDGRAPISNDDVIEMFAQYKPRLESRPNSRFKYCNSNYAILASIIEEVTEMKYPDFLRKYIFEPLGMKSTFVRVAPQALPSTATISYKYNWRREEDMFADGVYGDKNIYSTVEDMYKWDQSLYKNVLLNNETLEMAYGPCSFEKPGVKNYGLGWRMLCYPNGAKIIYHNGWWHGNNTVFYRFIQENFTIIILGNKYSNNIYRQAPVVYSIVKNKPVEHGFETEE
ncbi:MAG: beta-lactamase family protein [Bacteroidetes bacterium]|nr:beta-lactamase family protein [Bacteroidota bacterium]